MDKNVVQGCGKYFRVLTNVLSHPISEDACKGIKTCDDINSYVKKFDSLTYEGVPTYTGLVKHPSMFANMAIKDLAQTYVRIALFHRALDNILRSITEDRITIEFYMATIVPLKTDLEEFRKKVSDAPRIKDMLEVLYQEVSNIQDIVNKTLEAYPYDEKKIEKYDYKTIGDKLRRNAKSFYQSLYFKLGCHVDFKDEVSRTSLSDMNPDIIACTSMPTDLITYGLIDLVYVKDITNYEPYVEEVLKGIWEVLSYFREDSRYLLPGLRDTTSVPIQDVNDLLIKYDNRTRVFNRIKEFDKEDKEAVLEIVEIFAELQPGIDCSKRFKYVKDANGKVHVDNYHSYYDFLLASVEAIVTGKNKPFVHVETGSRNPVYPFQKGM